MCCSSPQSPPFPFFLALTPLSLPDLEYPSVPGAARGRLLLSFHHSVSWLIRRARLFRKGIYQGLPQWTPLPGRLRSSKTLAPVREAATHRSSRRFSHPRKTPTHSTFPSPHPLCFPSSCSHIQSKQLSALMQTSLSTNGCTVVSLLGL